MLVENSADINHMQHHGLLDSFDQQQQHSPLLTPSPPGTHRQQLSGSVSLLLKRQLDNAPPPVSPEVRAAAKTRAALTLIRAAVSIRRAPFEKLPEQTLRATRQLIPDDHALIGALEKMHSQQQLQRHYAEADAAAAAAIKKVGGAGSGSGGGGRNSPTRVAAGPSPVVGSLSSSSRGLASGGAGSTGFQSLKLEDTSTIQFVSGSTMGSLTGSPHSRSPHSACLSLPLPPHNGHSNTSMILHPHDGSGRAVSPSSRMRMKAAGRSGTSPTTMGRNNSPSGRTMWSPRRVAQVDPSNISLAQVISEVKTRVPAFRRGAPTTGSEFVNLVENFKRLFLLMDSHSSGLLRLSEDIAAFGRRIGGETQKLLRVSEMRARLHARFPDRYVSPALFFSGGDTLLEQHQFDSVAHNNISHSTSGHLHPKSSFVMNDGNQSSIILSAGSITPHGDTLTVPSVAASGGGEKAVRSVVRVMQPNPFEQPITQRIFVEAVLSAAEKKWTTQPPAVLLRSSPSERSASRSRTAASLQRQPLHATPGARSAAAGSAHHPSPPTSSANKNKKGGAISPTQLITITAASPSATHMTTPTSAGAATGRPAARPNSATTPSSRLHTLHPPLQRRASQASSSLTSLLQELSAKGNSSKQQHESDSMSSHSGAPPHVGGGGGTAASRLRRTDSSVSASSFNSDATSAATASTSAGGEQRNSAIPRAAAARANFFQVVRLLDPTNTGFITLEALIKACPRTTSVDAVLNSHPQFSMKSLFDRFDDDGAEKLTIEQFAEMMAGSFKSEGFDEAVQPELKEFAYHGKRIDWKKFDRQK